MLQTLQTLQALQCLQSLVVTLMTCEVCTSLSHDHETEVCGGLTLQVRGAQNKVTICRSCGTVAAFQVSRWNVHEKQVPLCGGEGCVPILKMASMLVVLKIVVFLTYFQQR